MYQNKEKRAILLGMAIGDGYISDYNNKYRLVIRHGDSQIEYLRYKKSILYDIFNRDISELRVQKGIQISIMNKIFGIYRKWLYRGREKRISNILKYLNRQSIALWYMDDGSLSAKRKNGKIHGYELTLNTYTDREENQKIIDWFYAKHTIRFTQTKSKDKYRLRMGTKEARKFIQIVRPYIHPSMSYKINIDCYNHPPKYF